jgi:hypothetical protein
MLTGMLMGVLGPAGRWIVDQYLTHGAQLSLLVLVWMVVVGVGQYHAGRLQRQIKADIRTQLGSGVKPEVVLAQLEPRWREAARSIRWMPAAKGWWTQPATDEGLREFAGFTPVEVDRLARALDAVKAHQARRSAQVHRKRRRGGSGGAR